MAINQVIYGDRILIDLTEDTVTEADVREGVSFHLPNGDEAVGELEIPSGTIDINANGTFDVKDYAYADVEIKGTYDESDNILDLPITVVNGNIWEV